MSKYLDLSIKEIHELLVEKKITPLDLVDEALERIEENKIDNKLIEKYINEFLSLDNPSRELIINLVEKIYIYQNKMIDIIFTFSPI